MLSQTLLLGSSRFRFDDVTVEAQMITLDRQQLERLPPEVRVARPADVLDEVGTNP